MIAILDASALLAFLQEEPGCETVASVLDQGAISSVNWSEVVQKAEQHGVDTNELACEITATGLSIVDFDVEISEKTASLWTQCKPLGLSFADRACLATAQHFQVPALTTDRSWKKLKTNISIQHIC